MPTPEFDIRLPRGEWQAPVSLSPSRRSAISRRIRQGRLLFRGLREHGPTDPGDLGVGTYFTTAKSRARGYGRLTSATVQLHQPLVLSHEQAYSLVDDNYQTCRGTWDQRKQGAIAATRMMRCLGFDGLVSVNCSHPQRPEWEVVVFPQL